MKSFLEKVIESHGFYSSIMKKYSGKSIFFCRPYSSIMKKFFGKGYRRSWIFILLGEKVFHHEKVFREKVYFFLVFLFHHEKVF
jgi:hypothetical protein